MTTEIAAQTIKANTRPTSYTPDELAKVSHLAPNTIRHLFRRQTGVLLIERPERMHKRRYTTMRIPHSVAVRVLGAEFLAA
jgi:AraC-like DNA-binding protein